MNDDLKQSIKDAWNLKMAINAALLAFRKSYNGKSKESEITFRYQAIEGMLLIAVNDSTDLAMGWEKDYQGEKINFADLKE